MVFTTQLSRFLERLAKPLLVACVLMLAAGPIVDGLMCGFEPATAEMGLFDAGHDSDDDGGSDQDHAVCAHGHCHHGSPLTGDVDVAVAGGDYAASIQDRVAAPQPPSANQPTLERPPRV